MHNEIPVMDDPLGKYWDQPHDIREAPMDDTHVLLTQDQIYQLKNYDASFPSGVYPGKCWLRTNAQKDGSSITWLVWYGDYDKERTSVSNNFREVLRV